MDNREELQSFPVDTLDSYAVDCTCYEQDSVRSHYIDVAEFDDAELRSHPIVGELRSHPIVVELRSHHIDTELRSHFIDCTFAANRPPNHPTDGNQTAGLQSHAINQDVENEDDDLQCDAIQVHGDGYAESIGDNFSCCCDLPDLALLDTGKR